MDQHDQEHPEPKYDLEAHFQEIKEDIGWVYPPWRLFYKALMIWGFDLLHGTGKKLLPSLRDFAKDPLDVAIVNYLDEEYSTALEQFRALREAESSLPAIGPRRLAAINLYEGNTQYILGNLDEALACYDRCVVLHPSDPRPWHNRGVVLSEMGLDEEALRSFDQALSLRDDDYGTWYQRGLVLATLARHE